MRSSAAVTRPSSSTSISVRKTSERARTAGADEGHRHTLAVRDGNVLAIGDSSFIAADRYNVGDTDVFLSSVVEFLLSGDSDYDPAGAGGTDAGSGGSDGNGGDDDSTDGDGDDDSTDGDGDDDSGDDDGSDDDGSDGATGGSDGEGGNGNGD